MYRPLEAGGQLLIDLQLSRTLLSGNKMNQGTPQSQLSPHLLSAEGEKLRETITEDSLLQRTEDSICQSDLMSPEAYCLTG